MFLTQAVEKMQLNKIHIYIYKIYNKIIKKKVYMISDKTLKSTYDLFLSFTVMGTGGGRRRRRWGAIRQNRLLDICAHRRINEIDVLVQLKGSYQGAQIVVDVAFLDFSDLSGDISIDATGYLVLESSHGLYGVEYWVLACGNWHWKYTKAKETWSK